MGGEVDEVERGIRTGLHPLRVGGGLAVSALLIAGLASLVGPSRLAERIGGADPLLFTVAATAGLAGLLLRARAAAAPYAAATDAPADARYYLLFVFASLPKRVVPGGYVAGPGIEAFVLSRRAGTRFESTFAGFAVAEFLNLVASVTVAVAGLSALVVLRSAAPGRTVAAALGGAVLLLLAVAAAVVLARDERTAPVVVRGRDAVARTVDRFGPTRHVSSILAGRATRGVREFAETTRDLADDRDVLLEGLTVATAANVVATLPLYFGLWAIGADVSIGVALLSVPVAGLLGVSPLPGGVGGTEVVLSGLLVALAGLDPTIAAAGTVVYRLATLGVGTTAGAVAAGLLTAIPGPSSPV